MIESPFDKTVLDGVVDCELIDENGRDPKTIIRTTDAFKVKTTLKLSGIAVPFLGGTFHVTAYAEDLAGPFEGKLGDEVIVPCDGTAELKAEIPVPAFGDMNAGTYKLMVIWLYKNVGGKKDEIATFYDGPVFQIYDPAE